MLNYDRCTDKELEAKQVLLEHLAYLDKHKSIRHFLFRNVEPKLKLIAKTVPMTDFETGTVTSETLPAFTARESHQSKGTYQDDLRLTENLIDWGHMTPFHALTFVYRVEGISKSLAAQWTRHQTFHCDWTFRSTRYVDSRLNGFVYPLFEYLDDPMFAYEEYEDVHKIVMNRVESLTKQGVDKQEARRLQPVGFATSAYVYTNARQLMHFFELRVAPHAENEHRRFAIMWLLDLYGMYPRVFGKSLLEASERIKKLTQGEQNE